MPYWLRPLLWWLIGVIAAVYVVVEVVLGADWFWPFVAGVIIGIIVMRELARQREQDERIASDLRDFRRADMEQQAEMRRVKRRTNRQARTSKS